MTPTPLYLPQNIDSPAYHWRYAWIGWPSDGLFPKRPSQEFFTTLESLWETDGIRVLESNWSAEQIQFTCSVKPAVSPTFFTARMKGRLQHALRVAGTPTSFSRKVAFRSIGENRREQVEAYIGGQVSKERFVDDRFEEFMKGFTVSNADVRLQDPSATERGRYWYNLHVVLVTESRMRFTDEGSLRLMAKTCDKVSIKKSYGISRRSVMPDHIHLSLRGNVEHSPEDVALSFMNNIAFAFGQKAIFRPSYYVGTFGEYDMGAVR
jgi:REP element-mobilizing transposase RayT